MAAAPAILARAFLAAAVGARCACGFQFLGKERASRQFETFTIVVNTFQRDACLQKVVEHYLTCRGVVDTIRVAWNEPSREPPVWLTSLEASTTASLAWLAPRVIVDHNEGSNLTNRFKSRDFASEAIFSQDDDLFYSCHLLSAGFQVWRQFPRQLVGFGPRFVPFADPASESRDAQGARASWTTGYANVVLVTKGGWLHREYFKAYFDSSLRPLRDIVDGNRTGEDMLMALLVANRTGLPPVPLLVPSQSGGLQASLWQPGANQRFQGAFAGAQGAEKHLTNYEFQCGGGLTEGPGNSNRKRGSVFKALMQAFDYNLPSTTRFVDPLKGPFGGPGMADSRDPKYERFELLGSAKFGVATPAVPTCATYEQAIHGQAVKMSPEDTFLALLDPQKRPLFDEEQNWWQPEGCDMKVYRPEEACELLGRMGHKRVLFIGDSFVRQLYLAFLQVLLEGPVGDKTLAPTPPWAPSSRDDGQDFSRCSVDVLATETNATRCRHHFARDTWLHFDQQRRERLCGGKIDLEFVYGGIGWHPDDQREEEYPRIRSANRTATLVVMGFGIWQKYFSSEVIPQVVDHLAELKNHFSDPSVIWHAAHARHRFDFWHQSNDDVKQFNANMREWTDKFTTMKTIDFYDATLSMHSFDGAHYGAGPNRVKSMLLLSFLEGLAAR